MLDLGDERWEQLKGGYQVHFDPRLVRRNYPRDSLLHLFECPRCRNADRTRLTASVGSQHAIGARA